MPGVGVPRVGAFQRHGTVRSHTQHFSTIVETKSERAIGDGFYTVIDFGRTLRMIAATAANSEDVTTGPEQNWSADATGARSYLILSDLFALEFYYAYFCYRFVVISLCVDQKYIVIIFIQIEDFIDFKQSICARIANK